ncbi:MAG: enoyl-CoA hydratase/isomerase family protein [Chloroflexota bacterium]
MQFETLKIEISKAVGTLTLNRPDRLNALSPLVLRELAAAAHWFDEQDNVRVVIIRGEGRAFSAGADLKEPMAKSLETGDWAQRRERGQLGRRMAEAIERMQAVTIAQVHGYAIGGGLVLMLACDLRVVAEDTVFSIPEVDLGIPLAWGGIPRLVREIGSAMTKELVMTCRRFSPQEAKSLGIINRVVPVNALAEIAQSLADDLAAKPSVPVIITKEHVNAVATAMGSGLTSFGDGDALVGIVKEAESAQAAQDYRAKTVAKKKSG